MTRDALPEAKKILTKTKAPEELIEDLKTEAQKKIAFTVVKRGGHIVPFNKERIEKALDAAFRDTKKVKQGGHLPEDIANVIESLTSRVTTRAFDNAKDGNTVSVEGLQDMVEEALLDAGYTDVARDYIIYRDTHTKLREDSPRHLKIARRDGSMVRFNPIKISGAIEMSFHLVEKHSNIVDSVNQLTEKVITRAIELSKEGTTLTASLIQDVIEKNFMENGFFDEAKAYILYRQEMGEKSEAPFIEEPKKRRIFTKTRSFKMRMRDGSESLISEKDLKSRLDHACSDLDRVDANLLLEETIVNFYEGIKEHEVDQATILATRSKIELEPEYSKVAARLLRDIVYREAMGISTTDRNLKKRHKEYFKEYIRFGAEVDRVNSELQFFDLDKLADAMDLDRDDNFSYLGLQTLYDRYFIHHEERRLETPQIFWMRVAMGLALNEDNREESAIEFYDLISEFWATSATPTLFNSGTTHSQLSSCYLSTIGDDLENIFKTISDDAQLSKWAGGIGNDWTNVRATGSRIKGTNGKSQGVIPFMKVANDTAVAVNQGGKRKGAMCAYLEPWHLDIEDFLDLRKNTGDERRRTHDMHTANWIPDLFMKRVSEEGSWTLFSPSDTPDLHDLYGAAFEKRYEEYERMAEKGELKLHKKIEAVSLWRKMLSMLFETGHPWMTFKDPSNLRSPQDHAGVVHSSNLCTEILLNTSKDETAVCNLASVNLPRHMNENGIDEKRLAKTVRTLVRMLDNVIDINFYPIPEAQTANLNHRAIGMGLMGFQDALYKLGISYASPEAVEFADRSMEMISYYAIFASSELAKERGAYPSYKGSKWDRGLLPIDTISLLEDERGGHLEMDRTCNMDWTPVREHIKAHGMRNCNTMAIAPTATISNILGSTQSIEPMYKHLFVKSNLSGEFTMTNTFLVDKLRSLGLWDKDMLDDLKYFDGSIQEIERIPEDIKSIYLTAFEIEPEWLIECASRRQKWIDQGQSLNLYLSEPSGKKMHNMYMFAWKKGLKTTYYLRALAATQIEKSTTDVNKRGLQPRWMKNKSASGSIQVKRNQPAVCNLGEDCESCQ